MPPRLNTHTATQLVRIVRKLDGSASFRHILREANSQSVLTWNVTLRRYLDLLVIAGILSVSERDVGSVHPQQVYTETSTKAHLWTGPRALKLQGLNWEVSDSELYQAESDLEAVVRAKTYSVNKKARLITSLEDTLLQEIRRDAADTTGTTELVAAMLATQRVDLPYLLRRADKVGLGKTARQLFKKITETFTSLPGESEGRVFLETRTRFLKLLREYNSKGLLKLVADRGQGQLGLEIVQVLSKDQIVSAAGKQLGVSG